MAKTCFFWDELEDNFIEEYDDAGVTIANYTTEPDNLGNIISQHRSGQSSFFHYDVIGSTLAVTDVSQNVTDTRAYSAFGETTESSGSTVFPFEYVGKHSYYRNFSTGELTVRRRNYIPTSARWLSADPLLHIVSELGIYGSFFSFGQSFHKTIPSLHRARSIHASQLALIGARFNYTHIITSPYYYCHANPLNYKDPTGLAAQWHHWFPQFQGQGQAKLDKLCCSYKIDINSFTTPYENSRVGSAHYEIHHGYNYIAKIDAVYRSARSCCDLLRGVVAAMVGAVNHLKAKGFEDPFILVPYRHNEPRNELAFYTMLGKVCPPSSSVPPTPDCSAQYDQAKRAIENEYRACLARGRATWWCRVIRAWSSTGATQGYAWCMQGATSRTTVEIAIENPELTALFLTIVSNPELIPVAIPVLLPKDGQSPVLVPGR